MSETRDKIIASIIASPENAADAFIKLQNECFELAAEVKRWQVQSNTHYMRVCELDKLLADE